MMSNQLSEPLDPDLVLSEHTLNALKEFYAENSSRFDEQGVDQNNGLIEENWVMKSSLNLSQN